MAADDLRPSDLEQLDARGISREELERQLRCFREGFPPLALDRPATLGDGIETVPADDSGQAELIGAWEEAADRGRLGRFVPASGAASRMFRFLAASLRSEAPLDAARLRACEASKDGDERELHRFFERLEDFAFYPALRAALAERGVDLEAMGPDFDRRRVVRVLLEDCGYADLPKGLIPFHRHADRSRTAFEEHLVEAGWTVADADQRCRTHFTVAPEYRERIEAHLKGAAAREGGRQHELAFSEQSPSTDTVAVDLENRPLRDEQGRLVFRPGGHGALIENLDRLEAEIVFIKNIDNVAIEEHARRTVVWKKLLAGVLLRRRVEARRHFEALEGGDAAAVDEARRFCETRLHRPLPASVAEAPETQQRRWLRETLDRPTRVCGMVRNEGEPGGGPFWVRQEDGTSTLQIVESSQVDHGDPHQQEQFEAATHFNPVDLVCALRGFDGEPYELARHVDPQTGFIAHKSKDGRELKALERPGLWNGAMAYWNTIFVEVPLSTFQPVKTVNDLLRPAHQDGD